MLRKIIRLGLTVFVFGLLLAGVPVRAEVFEASRSFAAAGKIAKARRFGPYATLRRANEVANYARSLGYNAKVIYGGSMYYYGSREYYVDVW